MLDTNRANTQQTKLQVTATASSGASDLSFPGIVSRSRETRSQETKCGWAQTGEKKEVVNWRLSNTPNDLLVHHGQIRYSNCIACCQKFNLDSATRNREKSKLKGRFLAPAQLPTCPVPQWSSDLLVGHRVIGAPATPGRNRLIVGETICRMWEKNRFPGGIFPPMALSFSKVHATDASSTGLLQSWP